MQILNDLNDFPKEARGATLTVGKFDGVHLGHQRLLKEAASVAKRQSGPVAVMTFEPHPCEFLQPGTVHERLMDPQDLLEQMEKLHVDFCVVQNFDAKFAGLTGEQFLSRLEACTSLKGLVVGPDFKYGRGQGGSAEDLLRWAQSSGVILQRVPRVKLDGEDISSTTIKRLLKEYRFDQAGRMLGRRYYLRGEVIRGEGRGKKLGVPTANFAPTVLPPLAVGVYAGWARTGEIKPAPAVLSVGRKPTFWEEGTYPLTYECHLLDWSGDLYGRCLHFEPHSFLRNEMKFQGVEALKQQIFNDIDHAREVLK